MLWKVLAIIALILAGPSTCVNVGPGTVARDRFDYISAISDSWKSRMLFNLLKLRYEDAPVLLDVASVINQYGIDGSLGLSREAISLKARDSLHVNANRIGYGPALLGYQKKRP